jgi:hypothetical protein
VDTVGILLLGMMINYNPSVGDFSVLGDVANDSVQKKKMVLVPLVMPVHPCAKQLISLLIALVDRSWRRGSLINFL